MRIEGSLVDGLAVLSLSPARPAETCHRVAEDGTVAALDAGCAMRHPANLNSVITHFIGRQDREIAQTLPAAAGDFWFGHF